MFAVRPLVDMEPVKAGPGRGQPGNLRFHKDPVPPLIKPDGSRKTRGSFSAPQQGNGTILHKITSQSPYAGDGEYGTGRFLCLARLIYKMLYPAIKSPLKKVLRCVMYFQRETGACGNAGRRVDFAKFSRRNVIFAIPNPSIGVKDKTQEV